MIRIGLLGSTGRMGQWVTRLLQGDYSNRAVLAAQVSQGDALDPLLTTDAVIDFSLPDAFVALADAATRSNRPLPVFVVGSTGWKPEQTAVLTALAEKTPVLQSSNFSTGVLALQQILKSHSSVLCKLGYAPVMVETHHRHKKDAPSGTALMLNRTIESSADVGPVQTHAIRGGEIVGDHEVSFYGPADHLVLGHFAQDRSVFARGALDAALWLHGRRSTLASKNKVLSMEQFFSELIQIKR